MPGKLKALFIKYETTIVQFIKVNLIGIINTFIDWGLFALLNSVFDLHRYIVAPISYTCGIANSFLLNKFWAFKKHSFRGLELLKFIVVNLLTLAIKMLTIEVLKTQFGINETIGNMLATPIIFVVNFVLYKYWVFKSVQKTNSESA